MSDRKLPLAWNGGVKPKPPSEGFATSIGVGVGVSGPAPAAPAPRPRRGPSLLETEEGVQVDVRRMGESEGPEVVRPTGRVRLTRS